MLWVDKVFSRACHAPKIAASTTAKTTLESTYGMPNPTCTPSAAMVPNTLTMTTADQ